MSKIRNIRFLNQIFFLFLIVFVCLTKSANSFSVELESIYLPNFDVHDSLVASDISQDGRFVAAAFESGCVKILDLKHSCRQQVFLEANEGKIKFLKFSRNTQYIIAYTQDNMVYVWNRTTMDNITINMGCVYQDVSAIDISDDNHILLISTFVGKFYFVNLTLAFAQGARGIQNFNSLSYVSKVHRLSIDKRTKEVSVRAKFVNFLGEYAFVVLRKDSSVPYIFGRICNSDVINSPVQFFNVTDREFSKQSVISFIDNPEVTHIFGMNYSVCGNELVFDELYERYKLRLVDRSVFMKFFAKDLVALILSTSSGNVSSSTKLKNYSVFRLCDVENKEFAGEILLSDSIRVMNNDLQIPFGCVVGDDYKVSLLCLAGESFYVLKFKVKLGLRSLLCPCPFWGISEDTSYFINFDGEKFILLVNPGMISVSSECNFMDSDEEEK